MRIQYKYEIFSSDDYYKYHENDGHEEKSREYPSQQKEETSLAIVDDLKWVIRPEYLMDVIIDDRFKVGKELGKSGFTGFVRSGKKIMKIKVFAMN